MKVIGYKTRLSDPEWEGKRAQKAEEDPGWDSANSEEGHWREDENSSRVSRVHADECDPSSACANEGIRMG